MSHNLDRSLDEILANSKPVRRARGKAAPAGGIRKRSARVQQRNAAAAAAAPATKAATNTSNGASGRKGERNDTKILVSHLPQDVSEQQIKEYFAKVVGAVKRCSLAYGPNGISRGIATIEFAKAGDANTACEKYDGVVVDKRPMKVEIIVDPKKPSSFADRVKAPAGNASNKLASKPKAVTSTNAKGNAGGRKSDATSRRGGKGGQSGRGGQSGQGGQRQKPKKKTAEELDAEMADYFTGSANTDTNAAAGNNAAAGATTAA